MKKAGKDPGETGNHGNPGEETDDLE